jgi:hypothetical protein
MVQSMMAKKPPTHSIFAALGLLTAVTLRGTDE